VVDLVFCLDVSDSMKPCIHGVREHVGAFLEGLHANGQWRLDWRLDFLAHACDSSGAPFRPTNIRRTGMDLLRSLYGGVNSDFFATELDPFRTALDGLSVGGDEATLIALDLALDFPWRPRTECHRVVACLTDEPVETGARVKDQTDKVPALIEKIQALGVMLFLVAPESPAFEQLSEADRSEYQVVDAVGDGLSRVDFSKILARIGRSVSVAHPQLGDGAPVQRALFGQDRWVASFEPIRGR
jgi:hypothetical protein